MNSETAFPLFLAGYIDALRTLVDLPASAVLPCVVGPNENDDVFPKIFLHTEKSESVHHRRFNLQVIVQLQSRMEKTALANEEVWCASLHRLLSDGHVMRQYLSTLAPAAPFDLRRYRITAISTALDIEKQLRARQIEISAHLRTHETAPLA